MVQQAVLDQAAQGEGLGSGVHLLSITPEISTKVINVNLVQQCSWRMTDQQEDLSTKLHPYDAVAYQLEAKVAAK
jgi:hypothetical protein